MSDEKNEAVKTELKTPSKNELFFEANGKKYFPETKISIARKILCDRYVVELGAGLPITQMFERVKEAFAKANELKMADCAVILHNAMSGLNDWDKREDAIMNICALYINTENEDRRSITEEQIKIKIDDWETEGIEYAFFLTMAQAWLSPVIKSWNDISRSISEEKEKKPNENEKQN